MTGVRSYLAGTGASGSLLLAAFVAFLSVTAFVGFDALPLGGGDAGAETVALEGPDDGTVAAAAAAAAGPPATVAAVPAAPAPGAPGAAPGAAAGAGGGAGAGAPGPGGDPADTGAPGVGPATQTDVPAPPTPTGGPTNPVDDLVAGVDQTLENTTGVNPNLGPTTEPVTDALDETLQDVTGDNLGGHLNDLLGPGGRATPDLGLTP